MDKATNWYALSREAILRIFPKRDFKLVCALIASTSPHSSLPTNITLAIKAYNQIKMTGGISREGFINTHYKCINAVLKSGRPNGRKARSFYENLKGNEQPVTVDVWMMRYAGLSGSTPSNRQYDNIEFWVASEAFDLGITPAQRQAQIWCKARGKTKTIADYLCQMRLF